MAIIQADTDPKINRIIRVFRDGAWFRMEGECLRCGQCCARVNCVFFRDKKCSIHGRHPWQCFLAPADALLFEAGCGYRLVADDSTSSSREEAPCR